jgi:hypothetical protein
MRTFRLAAAAILLALAACMGLGNLVVPWLAGKAKEAKAARLAREAKKGRRRQRAERDRTQ